jgi:hypothetical protein
VAKTISAYDKEVSDDLYGSGSRYVSKQRLQAMLENEWTQLVTQLSKSRGSQTRFFCFVDTVSARNFAGTNDAHGWIGLRFQLQPGGPPNDVLLHVNMRDPSNVLQQQAIGILGVNLIGFQKTWILLCAMKNTSTRNSYRRVFEEVAAWVMEQSGLNIPADQLEFDIYDNSRGRPNCQGKVAYRGPVSPTSGGGPRSSST